MQPNRMTKIILFSFINLWSISGYSLTVSVGLGLGSTSMQNETKEVESPFTQAYTVERLFHSKLSGGVEHLRSLTSGLSTSAAFTGIVARYYLNAAPVRVIEPGALSPDQTVSTDYSIFVASGFGYAQSSRLPNEEGLSSNAAGLYISPRFGAEMQLDNHLGARTEMMLATTLIGTGNVTQFSLSAALYWMY